MENSESSARTANRRKDVEKPTIKDPRFADFQTNPRYRLPTKRNTHVKVDKRFSRMLKDDDFARKAKVDRYGRPLQAHFEKDRLKRLYAFDEDDEPDDDADVQRELKRVKKTHDPIRDGGYGSSSDSSSEEEEVEGEELEEIGLDSQPEQNVPMGEVSSRIAVVNLDWDNIRAVDLMVVFSSFLPTGGTLSDVSVYPSEFGREKIEKEEFEGPPKEIFLSGKSRPSDGRKADEERNEDLEEDRNDEHNDKDEDDETIKQAVVKPDDGDDFDSAKLREYQLERLRYFYAVLTFSSTETAKSIYDAVDGTEYLTSANFFDLRFVPDSTDFSIDNPRDSCRSIPEGYRPNEFVTTALQHSKVKLTWDADDSVRKEAQARAFSGGRKEIDENDLKAYLGSETSDDEEDDQQQNSNTKPANRASQLSSKDSERQKTRALLGLGAEPVRTSKSNKPVGDMQITFSSGLSENRLNGSVFVNEPEETTAEKYVRKERERKQRRKEKSRQVKEGVELASTPDNLAKELEAEAEDLGFDDPFFAAEENNTVSATARRKEERRQKKAEREQEEAVSASQRRELELLMVDDQEAGVKHFNMDEIEKAQKRSKKNKKSKYKKSEGSLRPEDDEFKMNVDDPRFSRLFENHEYAIDPSNPRFRSTEGMNALLEEGRKRRQQTERGGHEIEAASSDPNQSQSNNKNDIRKLVKKVKGMRKS